LGVGGYFRVDDVGGLGKAEKNLVKLVFSPCALTLESSIIIAKIASYTNSPSRHLYQYVKLVYNFSMFSLYSSTLFHIKLVNQQVKSMSANSKFHPANSASSGLKAVVRSRASFQDVLAWDWYYRGLCIETLPPASRDTYSCMAMLHSCPCWLSVDNDTTVSMSARNVLVFFPVITGYLFVRLLDIGAKGHAVLEVVGTYNEITCLLASGYEH
jgi:hypothetical protein